MDSNLLTAVSLTFGVIYILLLLLTWNRSNDTSVKTARTLVLLIIIVANLANANYGLAAIWVFNLIVLYFSDIINFFESLDSNNIDPDEPLVPLLKVYPTCPHCRQTVACLEGLCPVCRGHLSPMD
jgi:hypothetical protein